MPLIKLGFKKYELIKEFSFCDEDTSKALAIRNGKKYVLTKCNNHFHKISSDLLYLKKCGIRIPRIIKVDKKNMMIVQEYVEGPTVLELLSQNNLDEKLFEDIFLQYRFCRFSKFSINFLPSNFIYCNKQLYYMAREVSILNDKNNFEDNGLRYWIASPESEKLAKSMGYSFDHSRVLSNGEINKQCALMAIKYY